MRRAARSGAFDDTSGDGQNQGRSGTRVASIQDDRSPAAGRGALGAYQAGVYEALAEANVLPTWIAGISIGAVNSALIAGNAPEKRVAH